MITLPIVTLRPIQKTDAIELMNIRNAPHTFHWFYSNRQFTLQEVEQWIENIDHNKELVFMGESNGEVVGTASIYNIEDGRAEIGRAIVKEGLRGYGFAISGSALLIKKAKEYGIRVLYANIMKDNISSWRTAELLGYKRIEERVSTGYYYELLL